MIALSARTALGFHRALVQQGPWVSLHPRVPAGATSDECVARPLRGCVPTQRAALPALSPNPRAFQGSVFCGLEHNAVLFVVTKTRTWEPFSPAAPPLAPRFAAVPVAGRAG